MDSFSTMVEKIRFGQFQHNIAEAQKNTNSDWIKKKITNYSKRTGIAEEIIVDDIKKNELTASFFCKNPTRQNSAEKIATYILGTKTLPSHGKNSVRFDANGNRCSRAIGTTKSADFFINGYYYTQKFTTGEGGAQDNQKADVVDFLTKGSVYNKVGALLDGDYWERHIGELKEAFANNPNVKITSISNYLDTGELI